VTTPAAAQPDAFFPARQDARDRFADVLRDAVQGQPRLLLFAGEAGSGKTHLLRQIADSPLLPRRRIRVVTLQLDEGAGSDIVQRAAALATRHALYARWGGRRRILGAVQRLLPDWLGALPLIGKIAEAVIGTVQVVRKRRRAGQPVASVAEDLEGLHGAARRKPLVIIVDALEHASEPDIERLRHLIADAEGGTRLLVVGAFRSASPGTPGPSVARMAERLPAPRCTLHVLLPLPRGEVTNWLNGRFPGVSIPVGFEDVLLEETGGQPGAIDAALAALRARGAIRSELGRWIIENAQGALADDDGAARGEINALPADLVKPLQTASLMDEEVLVLRVAQVLESDELEIEDQLATAARLGVLTRIDDARAVDDDVTTVYRFASASLRAALRRSVSAAERARIQERALRLSRAGAGSADSP
jgi:type II secretory pathway predicted ATPase ExeA